MPPDVDFLTQLREIGSAWLGPLFASGALLLTWRTATTVTSVKEQLGQHEKKHERMEKIIEELQIARREADTRIAKLPTKEDLNAVAERLQSQLQAGFAQAFSLMATRRD